MLRILIMQKLVIKSKPNEMKKLPIILILLMSGVVSKAQVLLEDKDGEKIATNFGDILKTANNFSLIKLSTGDQSLGFNYYISTKIFDASNYKISAFSLKAKPTEGYAAVISNGQFSPGVGVSYSLTKFPIFFNKQTGTIKPADWGGIDVSYDVNKYLLYNKDTSFANQIYSKNFNAFSLGINYNLLLKQTFIVSAQVGYSRRNNYDELTSLEIKDTKTFFDSATLTQRQSSKNKTVKSGAYKEFDAYPISFSITKATATDDLNSAGAAKLKIGYTVYIKTLASQDLPKTDAGILIFLTRQGKSGVRTPVLGINFQAKDFFDVQKINNGLLKRIQVGFTTNFTL
jgi:hypothetical protein